MLKLIYNAYVTSDTRLLLVSRIQLGQFSERETKYFCPFEESQTKFNTTIYQEEFYQENKRHRLVLTYCRRWYLLLSA